MPNLVDIISLVIMLFLVFLGAMAGFTKKILSLVSWILAAAAAFYWFHPVETWVLKLSGMPTLSALVASFGIFLCFLVLLMVLCSKIANFVKSGAFKGADRVLGALLGGITAIIVLGIGYRIMDALEIPAETADGKPTHIKPWVMTWTEQSWMLFQQRFQKQKSVKHGSEGNAPQKSLPSKLQSQSAPTSKSLALWETAPGAHLIVASSDTPTLSTLETHAQSASLKVPLSPILPTAKPNFLGASNTEGEGGSTVEYLDLERNALTELMEHADA